MCQTCGCSGRFKVRGEFSEEDSQAGIPRQTPIERFMEPCILLLLLKGPSHGYGLLDDLEKQCGETVDVGNLYRTLRRMEKDGWVSSNWGTGENGPKKRVYELTEDGKEFLRSWAAGLEKNRQLIERFLEGFKKQFGKGGDK